jgi:lipoprotein-anchoring transpeptidase ErfK/SrfK
MNYLEFFNKIKWIGILSGVISCTGCVSAYEKMYVPPEQLPAHISKLGVTPTQNILVVDTQKQTMVLMENNTIKKSYTISTGKRGVGQRANTFRTPQGLHRINEKIGEGVPRYGIFHRRQYTGAAWKKQKREAHKKDYISTRILRLEGLQPGLNKGKDWLGRSIDSETRAIYIHGTTMEWKLGSPCTKGCVHMSADDVIKLYNEVPAGTLVWIN